LVHVHVPDVDANPIHATVHMDDAGRVWLTDLNTALGTMLNGFKVSKAEVHDGDEVLIGSTRIEIAIHDKRRAAGKRRKAVGHDAGAPICKVASPAIPTPVAAESGLKVEMDRLEATYRPGETLSGIVRLPGPLADDLTRLEATCGWSTMGTSEPDGADTRRVELELPVGVDGQRSRVYPLRFNLTAPNGPLSFEGDLFKLRWYVRARGQARDGRIELAERGFILAAWHEDPIIAPPLGYRDAPQRWAGAYHQGPSPLPGGTALEESEARIRPGWVKRVLADAQTTLRSAWLEARIEAPSRARAAESIVVNIRIRAIRTLTIIGVHSNLRGREVVGTPPVGHMFYEAKQPLTTRTAVVEEGDVKAFRARFVVPANAPSSFGASNHHVAWSIGVDIAVDYCPDLATERVVQVYPGHLPRGLANKSQ